MIIPNRDAMVLHRVPQPTTRKYAVAALAVVGIATACLATKSNVLLPILVWNASASAPIGLYWRRDETRVSRGDLVLVEPPLAVARFADQRRYLPFGVPLIKRVAALSGSTICGLGDIVSIDGKVRLKRQKRDGKGRPLPAWLGCHRLDTDEVFLAMEGVPDSFDGRYFGALPIATIKGQLVPLWTR